MKRVAVALAVLVAVLGIAACGEDSTSLSTSASSGPSSRSESTSQPAKNEHAKHNSEKHKSAKQKPVEPTEPTATASQEMLWEQPKVTSNMKHSPRAASKSS